jgi:hypothetical protein
MENQNLANWLEKSKNSDEKEIETYKQKIINQIKDLTKEDIIEKKEKLTLWKRIKKALNF